MEDRRIIFNGDAAFTVQRFDTTAPAEAKPKSIGTLSGYAMRWNTLSDVYGGVKFRLLPNSAQFATPTHALFHHDYGKILGSTANGTLRIMPDAVGVKVEIDLPDTPTGHEVLELVDRGDVGGMSFSMLMAGLVGKQKKEDGQPTPIMEVSSFACTEVTATAIPRFGDTSIGVKAEPVAEATATEMAATEKIQDSQKGTREDRAKVERMRLGILGRVSS